MYIAILIEIFHNFHLFLQANAGLAQVTAIFHRHCPC